jgi:protoporphyrinogen/coproporphyrinogen III oxidase
MPGPRESLAQSLQKILTEPIFKGFIPGAAMEHFRPQRNHDLEDESVGSFLKRRFGNTHIGDNLTSAIIHGIYAGDIYQLSIRSLMPQLWYLEGLHGSLTVALKERVIDGKYLTRYEDLIVLEEFRHRLSDIAWDEKRPYASVYTLKQGIGALSDALVAALKPNPKVRLKTSDKVKKISFDTKTNSLKVITESR